MIFLKICLTLLLSIMEKVFINIWSRVVDSTLLVSFRQFFDSFGTLQSLELRTSHLIA